MVDTNKLIVGLDSALRIANEKPNTNMVISTNLVVEMAERILELEEALEESNNVLLEYSER